MKRKRPSSLKWYILGAIVAAAALVIGQHVSKKGVDKVDAYLARRRLGR